MIKINKCKQVAKSLADKSKNKLGDPALTDFNAKFNKVIEEYNQKYGLFSTAIKLEVLDLFKEWLPSVLEAKELIVPILVDKMVNEQDIYSLSLYKSIYLGTSLAPDVKELLKYSELKSEYYESGGGETGLAIITGCYWLEQESLYTHIE